MSYQIYYTNFNKNQKIIEKKIFSNIIYPKYLIRKQVNNEFLFFDNNNNFNSFYLPNKTQNLIGFSFLKPRFFFKHNYLHLLTFQSFLNKQVFFSSKFSVLFYQKLKILSKKKTKKVMYLLKPVKGGFISYFSGFLGFLPRKNQFFSVNKVFKRLKKKLLVFHSNSFFLLGYNNLKQYFYINVSFSKIKVTVYPCFLTQTKRNRLVTNLNIIFFILKKKLHKRI